MQMHDHVLSFFGFSRLPFGKHLGPADTFPSAAHQEALSRLSCYEEAELEARHRAGYQKVPPLPDEFSVPERDRAWGDNDGIDTW